MAEGKTTAVSGLVAGIVGGVVSALLIVGWATHHPASVQQFLARTQTERGVSVDDSREAVVPESRIVQVVQAASPAVVSIVATQDVPVVEQFFDDSSGDPFGRFFGPFQFRVPQFRQRGTEQREIGGGSGFIVSSEGMIITNRHVVQQMNADYTVFTNDGQRHTAEVIARDPVNDIAVLKIEGGNLAFLEFGDSDALQAGQAVIAIGNALGEFRNTVSVGVISGLARSITAGDGLGQSEQLENVIQTDAAINPGNSGGPLLNSQGRVVGVNVAVVLGSENIGFALPSNLVRSVVESVQATGKISRPFLGIRYTMLTPAIAEQNRLSVEKGALIIRGDDPTQLAVVPGSPADKAGLKEGDVILEIDGTPLDETHSLASIIRTKKAGDAITLTVLHDGNRQQKNLTLDEFSTE